MVFVALRALLAVIALGALLPATNASAQEPSFEPVGSSGFANILAVGQGETANAVELAAYLGTGRAPATFTNQLGMYRDLVYAQPTLQASQLDSFFKPADLGVPAAEVGTTISPRAGVTIVRDRGFQVPHVYGETRADAMWGVGYAQAQDRLFFMDVLRHTGRGDLAEFAGAGEGDANIAADILQLKRADYTEQELQSTIETAARQGPEAREVLADANNYVDGINAYIAQARLNPLLMPGEYAAIGKPLEDWKLTDTAAIASLIGARFGRGGGREAEVSQILAGARRKLGRRAGGRVFADVIRREDAEAQVTIRERFPFDDPGRRRARASAIPDLGSLEKSKLIVSDSAGTSGARAQAAAPSILPAGMPLPERMSNAVLVDAAHSANGNPIAFMGPQIGYFSPEIFMEMGIHAPGGLDVRGGVFPGLAPYVLVGRGRDFAWSATSANTDNIDEFVSPLCEPDGSKPSLNSDHYRYDGECRPLSVQRRTLRMSPSAASQAPPRTVGLRIERTVYGPVQSRATVDRKPVVVSLARTTYMHDLDSALVFKRLNFGEVRSAGAFRKTMGELNFVFNWFYADERDIAYVTSGWYPRRAAGTHSHLPTWGTGRYDWRGFDPDTHLAKRLPFRRLPQATNPAQGFLVNWNNKQSPGWRAADDELSYSAVHRADLLERPLRRLLRKRDARPVDLVSLTERAATQDLRGVRVYPLMRKLIGSVPAKLRAEVRALSRWVRRGAHRRDLDGDNVYEHSAAVALMDEWWPRLSAEVFRSVIGNQAWEHWIGIESIDDHPSRFDPTGDNTEASSWASGVFGHLHKDLRSLLGKRVRDPLSRGYCGRGERSRCARLLESTLAAASSEVARKLGEDMSQWQVPATCPEAEEVPPPCDQIDFTTAGAVGVEPIPWQNRPTFQQLVSVERDAGR
jgi:acyl-homoserine lactone acylase PvdQ